MSRCHVRESVSRCCERLRDHARVAQIARLITTIIDSADLHRPFARSLARSFRAGDFSQVRDSADSWKQQRGPSVREGGVEGARSLGEINPSKTTRPHCLSSCLVIPGGYRTNGLFQVISRGVVVPSTRRAPSLFLTFSLPSLARFLRSGVTKERTYAERNLTLCLSFFFSLLLTHPPFSS